MRLSRCIRERDWIQQKPKRKQNVRLYRNKKYSIYGQQHLLFRLQQGDETYHQQDSKERIYANNCNSNGEPRCFHCGKRRHFAKACRLKTNDNTKRQLTPARTSNNNRPRSSSWHGRDDRKRSRSGDRWQYDKRPSDNYSNDRHSRTEELETCVIFSCRHWICLECFNKLLKNSSYPDVRCPICRADI